MYQRRKYIIVFLLTAAIFCTAWYASAAINKRKITELQAAQNKTAIDILASETQFDLLSETSCQNANNTIYASDLGTLADKINYSEQNVATPEEIDALKKQYTLLEVRDFLLTKRIAERCHQTPISIFYFYGTKDACSDCTRQGYVLDALRQSNPQIRVYSFDYDLDLSTIKALRSIYKIGPPAQAGDTLPALVINGTTYSGFQSLDQLNALISQQPPATTTH